MDSAEAGNRSPIEVKDGGPGGPSLLDGIALVAGAAIAGVHLKRAAASGLDGAGWVLLWITFAGVALTASGPFLAAIRRLSGRPGTPPRLGDRLWTLLGTPWVLAALPRIADAGGRRAPVVGSGSLPSDLYGFALTSGLGVAMIVAMAVVWSRWVMVAPGRVDVEEEGGGWSHRVGLVLGVAWPLQCGLGMIVLGAPE